MRTHRRLPVAVRGRPSKRVGNVPRTQSFQVHELGVWDKWEGCGIHGAEMAQYDASTIRGCCKLCLPPLETEVLVVNLKETSGQSSVVKVYYDSKVHFGGTGLESQHRQKEENQEFQGNLQPCNEFGASLGLKPCVKTKNKINNNSKKE